MTLNNQGVVAMGWLVGQFVITAVALYFHQKKLNISYWKAAPLYFEQETGSFVIGIAGLTLMLFLAPDFFDSNINIMDLRNKPTKTWKEWAQAYQRWSAAGIGGFIQLILIAFVEKGKKAIQKKADEMG